MLLEDRDFCPYFELKNLLRLHKARGLSACERARFCQLFSSYYGQRYLSDKWKKRFYEILFEEKNDKVFINGKPNFAEILRQLKAIPGKKGYYALHFSFTSKLVAIHDEESPIDDRHVRAFFGETVPNSKKSDKERISWFVEFVSKVKSEYSKWMECSNVSQIIKRLKRRDSRFEKCKDTRLLDFLIWKVGNKKLLVS